VAAAPKKTRWKSRWQNITARIYAPQHGGMASCYWCQVVLPICWRLFFLVLLELDDGKFMYQTVRVAGGRLLTKRNPGALGLDAMMVNSWQPVLTKRNPGALGLDAMMVNSWRSTTHWNAIVSYPIFPPTRNVIVQFSLHFFFLQKPSRPYQRTYS
jgi:hypothetical protein